MQKEYILSAAVWYKSYESEALEKVKQQSRPVNISKGIVFCGHSHLSCSSAFFYATIKRTVTSDVGESEQGFLTNLNRFVDRTEAAQIAFDAGQIKEGLISLYSEDLY